MPRIDPQQLLTCLSVLLSSNGGILSSTEVQRLANLMTKFSKKLVSKCVYVLILKNTENTLLGSFMAEGGWNLVHVWLQDAYVNKNWPLVTELLQLLLMTPVDVERLKMNNLPKVVKGLSRREDLPEIQRLSNELVQLWLKIVKDETKPQTGSIINNSDTQSSEKVLDLNVPDSFHKNDNIVENNLMSSIDIKQHLDIIEKTRDLNHELTSLDEVDTPREAFSDNGIKNAQVEPTLEEQSKEKDKKKESIKKSSSSKHKSSNSKSSSSHSSRDKNNSSSSSRDKERHRDKEKSSSSNSSSNSSRDKHRDKDKSKSKDRSREKDRSKEKDRRSKDEHRSNGSHSSSSKSDKEKNNSKEIQAEKDKDTLAKLQPHSISKLARIPKKNEDKSDDKLKDAKKPSMSIEVRKTTEERPKTVKVYNSKMRSTGLLEEAKPPPPRSVVTKKPTPALPTNISVKRSSPVRDPIPLPEKKSKLDSSERPGAIKLIPPKPKPSLQESDIFMDALNFAATANKKDTKKRKRRPSVNKEAPASSETTSSNSSPPRSPNHASDSTNNNSADSASSPLGLKNIAPFNFYQDTLNTEEEEEGKTTPENPDSKSNEDESHSPKKIRLEHDDTQSSDNEHVTVVETNITKGLKGVLLYSKKKGPKRSIRWKEDSELVEVQYFELDETERVNVTRAFTDMARMDINSEREALQLSRKTPNEDLMDVQTVWRIPIEIDIQSSISEVICRSLEKDIQFAREKSVLQALYFNKKMIPDSSGEPDPENQPITDPVIIPLEPTDETELEEPKTVMPWPEPKGSPPPQNMPNHNLHGMMQQQQMMNNFPPHMMGHQANMNPYHHPQPMQNFGQNINQPPPGQQGFQGGMPQAYGNPGNFMAPNLIEWNLNLLQQQQMSGNDQMMQQPNGPGMFPNDSFGGIGNDHHNNFQNPHFGGNGPHHQNQMYQSQNQGQHNFIRGGRGGFRRGGGSNWMRMNGPGNWNNNRGNSDRVGGSGGNRGSRICKNFKNHGYCRNIDNCQFYHPSV